MVQAALSLPADTDSIPENAVIDFIDGRIRKKTPEEYVRQNVERSLVQEYRYSREDLAVEFPIKVGSAKKRVDIAVFHEGKPHIQQNIVLIVECKKEGVSSSDKREGVEQLHSYMAACPNCQFAMWTNGTDERCCFHNDDREGIRQANEVVDLPLKGQSLRDAEIPTRMQLRPATSHNLLLAFKRCHNYIAGQQGLQKPEAFWELLKVIFCKIEDERSIDPVAFYITNVRV